MANPAFFKDVFDQLATDNSIGDPGGELAYCYLRVSSSGQAEEGRSGLPRQVMHVHEIALQQGFRIPWELVFADDHTGFQFRDRPELSRLRQEFSRQNRRANVVVIEYLDRLSRNADWHQGFLLDEMKEYGLQAIFWKSFSSRVERAVMGAISQEGMEHEIRRMAEGVIYKAKSGRITARTRAYGFVFVDSQGNPLQKPGTDTYYAHHPEESEIIKLIFQKIGIEGMSTHSLTVYLEERFPPPGRYTFWEPRQIGFFIRNPVYKGEFAANRLKQVRVPAKRQRSDDPVKIVSRKNVRPQEEWIIVPVPPIVSTELWELANRALDKNKQMSSRNARYPYLLTGIVKCATCDHSYIGSVKKHRKKDSTTARYPYYRCSAHCHWIRTRKQPIVCTQGQISASLLEDAVWHCVCTALLEPDRLLKHLGEKLQSDDNVSLQSQIRFIEGQIQEKHLEDEKLYRAYMADVFDEQEYAARREMLKESSRKLEQELAKLQQQLLTKAQVEEMQSLVLALSGRVAAEGMSFDAPFEVKQRIMKLVVDQVVLNVAERWFSIEGIVPGKFLLDESIESILPPKPPGKKQPSRWT